MSAADRFWPDGEDDARVWDSGTIDTAEWRRLCRDSYQRHEHEYDEPKGAALLVAPDESRSTTVLEQPSFNSLSHFWAAVRGTDYSPASRWDLALGVAHEIIVDLVPTPENQHDPFAIAVEYEGKKLGNVSRGYAARAQRKIQLINRDGYRAKTVAVYRAFHREALGESTPEAFVALPTFGRLDEHLRPFTERQEEFKELWDSLDSRTQDKIREDQYHLSPRTVRAVLRVASKRPHLAIHPKHDIHNFPYEFDYVLRDVRHADAEARAEQRNRGKQEGWLRDCEAVTELVHQEFTRKQITETLQLSEVRLRQILTETSLSSVIKSGSAGISDDKKDEVVRRFEEGQSYARIEREVGLGKGRARKVLDQRGIARGSDETDVSGISEWHREAMRQRLAIGREATALQRGGLTYRQIAARLGTSLSSVKKRLSDAHFFENPASNNERLATAIRIRQRRLTLSTCDSPKERRAIQDANVLDLIDQAWMP